MALKFHPDVNKASNAAAMFREINNAYEFLLKQPITSKAWGGRTNYPGKNKQETHKEPPKPDPRKKHDIRNFMDKNGIYFRPIPLDFNKIYNISLPERHINKDIIIHFYNNIIYKDERDFEITIPKGTILPTKLIVRNLEVPFKIHLEPMWGF